MYNYSKLNPEQRAELIQERLKRGFPPHAPPHLVRDQPFYLLTAACYEHCQLMASSVRRNQILDQFFEQFIHHGIEPCAWVVLPNHFHLLANVPDFNLLGTIFKSIHGTTARQWNLDDHFPGRKVWYRYTDRAIRSERHYLTTLNYIHYNPVKHGWTNSLYSWNETSVHWYLELYGQGWLRDLWSQYPLLDYGKDWDESS